MAILMFSSSRFGILAERAVERSAEFSPDALAAIVFSAFWVEAFVNEVIHRVNIDGKDLPNDPIGRLRQLAIAADLDGRDSRLDVKMQVIATSLTGSPFDTGRQPYQDFRLLMGLRNDLVHHKPETIKEALIEHEGSTLNIPEALHSRIKAWYQEESSPNPIQRCFGL